MTLYTFFRPGNLWEKGSSTARKLRGEKAVFGGIVWNMNKWWRKILEGIQTNLTKYLSALGLRLCYNMVEEENPSHRTPDVKEQSMNNILFFLTPKAMCAHLNADFTVRQALEKMEVARHNALPILNKKGEYCGALTEGDLLWALKNLCKLDLREAEQHRIMEIPHHKDHVPVKVNTSMHELIDRAARQNFVPVVDDKNTFIGIITRRAIIKYCQQELFPED